MIGFWIEISKCVNAPPPRMIFQWPWKKNKFWKEFYNFISTGSFQPRFLNYKASSSYQDLSPHRPYHKLINFIMSESFIYSKEPLFKWLNSLADDFCTINVLYVHGEWRKDQQEIGQIFNFCEAYICCIQVWTAVSKPSE